MSLIATFNIDEEGRGSNGRPLRHSIYLGGKTDAKDYDKLVHRWKVTHILNITPPKETNIEAGVPNYFETKRKFVYKRIPIYDTPTSVPELRSKYEKEIVRFIAKGLCHGNVFVHCSRGVSRSTSSVILYLMAKRHMSYNGALEMIRRRRPQACPIPAFEEWLRERDQHYHLKREARKETTATEKTIGTKRKRTVGAAVGPSAIPSIGNKKIGPAIGPGIGPLVRASALNTVPNTVSSGLGPDLLPERGTKKSTTTIGPVPLSKECNSNSSDTIGESIDVTKENSRECRAGKQ